MASVPDRERPSDGSSSECKKLIDLEAQNLQEVEDQHRPEDRPRIQFHQAEWRTAEYLYTGIVVISSTGEIVARLPRQKKPRNRNKYSTLHKYPVRKKERPAYPY